MSKLHKKKLVAVFLAVVVLFTALVPTTELYAATGSRRAAVVVVLDAGHGGKATGAARKWGGKMYREKTMNLAIALACKARLEEYEGVKVYLTRSTDRNVSLQGRVNYAKSKNADLFVSLHNNASLNTSSNGACVYYPNSNYKKSLNTAGRKAARSILNQLTALGIRNRGIMTRTSGRTRYPDRSRADYYQVIRSSKRVGIPGLIVEHAFVTNKKDCTTYLGSADALRKLGVADADGIAAYFGLAKASDSVDDSGSQKPDGTGSTDADSATGTGGSTDAGGSTGTGSGSSADTGNSTGAGSSEVAKADAALVPEYKLMGNNS
jgi:N-acetylmuramoyl-L-alanine amidase